MSLTTRRALPFRAPRGPNTTFAGDRGFVQGLNDPGLGLIRVGARDYDPTTGRFLQPDPLLDTTTSQQWNPYGYGNNNPLNQPDPTGLIPDDTRPPTQTTTGYHSALAPVPGVLRSLRTTSTITRISRTYRNPTPQGTTRKPQRKIGNPAVTRRPRVNPLLADISAINGAANLNQIQTDTYARALEPDASAEDIAAAEQYEEMAELSLEVLEQVVTLGRGDKQPIEVDINIARPIRDAKVRELRKKRPAAVSAGFGKDGKIVTGCSSNPVGCAEDDVARQIGGNPKDITFTEAWRPSKDPEVPICVRCQTKYDQSQFPPGTKWDRGRRWDEPNR